MVHGILWNHHQDKGQLDLDGFLESSTMQMDQLNGSRHVWLHRASASDQVRTTLKPLLQLCALQLYGLCWHWLQLMIWNCDLWTYLMHLPNSDVDVEIYIKQSEGFEQGGSKYLCRLNKSLYGLKQ